MNTPRIYIILPITTFISGFLFYAIYNQLILFRSPWNSQQMMNVTSIMQKKVATHYYFHGNKWKTEKQELLWTESIEKNVFQLINAWLTLLDEEHITIKKVTLQSALISTAGCVYLSFDHNILNKEDTIFKKWMMIEGLLKTITLNDIAISHVQFLLQHQQLQDPHLDFSLAWPIHGFIKSN